MIEEKIKSTQQMIDKTRIEDKIPIKKNINQEKRYQEEGDT